MLLKRLLLSIFILALSFALFNCISPKRKPVHSPTPSQELPVPAPPKSLAPGSAIASAVLLTCEEREKLFMCQFRIKTVDGYGAATPPLPKGTKINVEVSKTLFKKSSRSATQLLKKGNTLKMTLRYREQGPGKHAPASWRVFRFH